MNISLLLSGYRVLSSTARLGKWSARLILPCYLFCKEKFILISHPDRNDIGVSRQFCHYEQIQIRNFPNWSSIQGGSATYWIIHNLWFGFPLLCRGCFLRISCVGNGPPNENPTSFLEYFRFCMRSESMNWCRFFVLNIQNHDLPCCIHSVTRSGTKRIYYLNWRDAFTFTTVASYHPTVQMI